MIGHPTYISGSTLVGLLLLLLPWILTACAGSNRVTVAPAPDQPTFIWIFSDP